MARAKLALAVVGHGRAGRARVRVLEDHPRAKLGALVRREPKLGERTLEQVLEDPAIDGLILCTPNRLHASAARVALERGKHVLVEFPLAETRVEGAALFEQARRRARVLQVEHIELLSLSQQYQRERVGRLGRPIGGGLVFSGRSRGWIADAELAGSPALRAVARLHRLLDLFGEASARTAQLTPAGAAGYRLEVELSFRAGGVAWLYEERGADLEREMRWAVRCEQGELIDPPDLPREGLFREDLDHFIERVEGRELEPYVSEARVLHVLEVVGQIDGLIS